jgi:very-short-patch-repair endonuclease
VALPLERTTADSFDGVGTLEVDVLCADARVAVELDRAQHLEDAEVSQG